MKTAQCHVEMYLNIAKWFDDVSRVVGYLKHEDWRQNHHTTTSEAVQHTRHIEIVNVLCKINQDPTQLKMKCE